MMVPSATSRIATSSAMPRWRRGDGQGRWRRGRCETLFMRRRGSPGDLDDAHDLPPVLGVECDLHRQRTLAQGPFLLLDHRGARRPLLLPLMGLVEISQGHRLDVCHQVALARSEEHTSELQSQSNLVCRLLLEKKKNYITQSISHSATRLYDL